MHSFKHLRLAIIRWCSQACYSGIVFFFTVLCCWCVRVCMCACVCTHTDASIVNDLQITEELVERKIKLETSNSKYVSLFHNLESLLICSTYYLYLYLNVFHMYALHKCQTCEIHVSGGWLFSVSLELTMMIISMLSRDNDFRAEVKIKFSWSTRSAQFCFCLCKYTHQAWLLACVFRGSTYNLLRVTPLLCKWRKRTSYLASICVMVANALKVLWKWKLLYNCLLLRYY